MQSPGTPMNVEFVDSLECSVRSTRPRANSELVDSTSQIFQHRQSIQRASFRSHENAAINLREESELHRTVESLMADVESHRMQLGEEVRAKEEALEMLRKLRMEILELQEQLHHLQRNEVVSRMREDKLKSELDVLKSGGKVSGPGSSSGTLERMSSFKIVRLGSTIAEGAIIWAEERARKLTSELEREVRVGMFESMMQGRRQLLVDLETARRQTVRLAQLEGLSALQIDFQADLLNDFWKNQFSDMRSVASSCVGERRGPVPWYPPGVPNVNYRRDASRSPTRPLTPTNSRPVSPASHRVPSPITRGRSPVPSSGVSGASAVSAGRARPTSVSPRGSSYSAVSPAARPVLRAGSPASPRAPPPVSAPRTPLSPSTSRSKVSLSRTVENMESLLRELQKWRHTYQ